MALLAPLLALGCGSENQLNKQEEPEDLGDVDPDPGESWDACYDLDLYMTEEYLLDMNSHVCLARAGTTASNVAIYDPSATVSGEGTSAVPSDGVDSSGADVPIPVTVLFLQETSEGNYYYPAPEGETHYASGECPVDGTIPGAWDAYVNRADIPDESEGDVGALGACSTDCSFEPAVLIPDHTRADGTLTHQCADYEDMRVCLNFYRLEATDKVPISSECTPGSGSFRLVTVHMKDKDGDERPSAVFRPVQIDGTGTLTNAAWITYAAATNLQGQALRAVRVNRPFRFGDDDLLETPTLASVPVPVAGRTYPPGTLAGGAPFLLEEIPDQVTTDVRVSLEWTCRMPAPTEIVPSEPGYQFKLADIGCPVSWPQKFVVRPEPLLAPTRLALSLYGSVSHEVDIPLTVQGGDRTFAFTYAGVNLQGELLSWGGDGADVRIDAISAAGITGCLPGTYTLQPE